MPRTCGAMNVHYRLLRTDPNYAAARAASENRAFEAARGLRPLARTGTVVLPVVCHIIHNNPTENISDQQIRSQIDVLNRDFRMRNTDLGFVPQVFQSLAADVQVQFELAKIDPNGNQTNGITRRHTTATSFSDDDRVKSAATGGANPWPADRYLNIWVCALANGLLGYAQFPGGPAATDGVVITHTAFGTTGTAAAPFNLGRTATHEIGHWLNLRHIWGDDFTGCNGTDFVDDTPNQAGPNTGAPTFPHVTCNNGPSGDMFMNYMDYVDDAAMFMFTGGQVNRMRAALDGDRSTIGKEKIMAQDAISSDTTWGIRNDVLDEVAIRAKEDPEFRELLLNDARQAFRKLEIELPSDLTVKFHEIDTKSAHFFLPLQARLQTARRPPQYANSEPLSDSRRPLYYAKPLIRSMG